MHQVPQFIWKEIHEQIGLRSEMSKRLVQADDIDEAMDELYFELKESFEHNAISAFFRFGFLYLENKAISKYIEKSNDRGLRNALPEILSQEEIWSLFQMERMDELNQLEKQQLELLLYRALGTLEEIK
jgi:site-specific recombinase XerD